MRVAFTVCDEVRPLFRANGLDRFEALSAGDIGKKLRCERGGRELRRIVLNGDGGPEVFYLKRLGPEPVLLLARALLSGQVPHCGPLRELAIIQLLQQKGFAVMTPVAWGEQRRFGFPVCGFLVVREVCGEDVAQLYAASQAHDRLALLEEVGQLTGRLHAAGFYQAVRLKDLIRDCNSGQLVLIDRETSKPRLSRFSKNQAVATLARASRRTLRDGHRFGAATLRHFLLGYCKGVAGAWSISPDAMRRLMLSRLRHELGRRD